MMLDLQHRWRLLRVLADVEEQSSLHVRYSDVFGVALGLDLLHGLPGLLVGGILDLDCDTNRNTKDVGDAREEGGEKERRVSRLTLALSINVPLGRVSDGGVDVSEGDREVCGTQ